jgi:hypothetical protein
MAIPGSWTLFYSWGCGTSYGSTAWTFNANGTWSGGGYTGKWVQIEGMLLFNFDAGATTYGANVAGNIVAGTMTTFAGLTGCWYAKKSGVTPLTAAKQVADVAGVKKGAKKGASKKRASKKR